MIDPVKRDPILDQFSMITRPYTRLNGLKTIPFSSGTYPYSQYMGVPPGLISPNVCKCCILVLEQPSISMVRQPEVPIADTCTDSKLLDRRRVSEFKTLALYIASHLLKYECFVHRISV